MGWGQTQLAEATPEHRERYRRGVREENARHAHAANGGADANLAPLKMNLSRERPERR